MKKLYILILLLSFSAGLFAKDSFYYSGNKRIPLYEVEGKEVIITPAATTQIRRMAAFAGSEEIKDDRLVINVVSDSSASLKTLSSIPSPVRTENCYRDSQGLELIPTGYINLKLKREEDRDLLERRATEFGLEITEQNRYMPLWYELVINFENEESIIDIANRLYETGDFASCSPAFSFDGLEISYDPNVSEQWGLYNSEHEGIDINVAPAWDYVTGKGIRIAIVDCGVDLEHQDLAQNIYLSYDCPTKKSPAHVYGDHGTHCAGIAAAVRNNGIQIAGVAPDAQLMVAGMAFNSLNPCNQMADGINWSWQNGADIISCSWHSPQNDLVGQAIDAAVTNGRNGRGCVFVKSAGNLTGPITYPGDYRKEVIAVASLKSDGNRAESSCFGDNMLVSAPGVNILSTILNNSIDYKSGTSMACPHVSGVAALILQRNPKLTNLQVREILAKSTNQVGDKPYSTQKEFGEWNQWYGYGMIDAYKAVMNTPRK